MKSLPVLVAFFLAAPTLLFADLPLDRKTAPVKKTEQAVAQPVRKQADAHVQPGTFEVLKRISLQQKLMERQRKEAEKFQVTQKAHPPVVQNRFRQAEFLGKRIPFLKAPESSPSPRPQAMSRMTTTTNALINGKPADTVYVGDKQILSFSFAPGYVSAALLFYYDANNDGLVSEGDPLLGSSILLMDNDENDTDPAPGKYTLKENSTLSLAWAVGSYLLSVNDFQSVSTALLVVRQKPAPAVVHVATNPPVPMVLVQVYGSAFQEILFTDSTGKADIMVDRLADPQLQIGLYDYFGKAGGRLPPPVQVTLLAADSTDVVFNYLAAPSAIQGLYLDDGGKPIPGATIVLNGSYRAWTTTDSSGAFRLGVTGGTWYVSVQPPSADYLTNMTTPAVYVGPSDSAVHLYLTGLKANSTISGTIRYLSGGVGGVLVGTYLDTLSNTILTGAGGGYSLPVWKPQSGSVTYPVYPYLNMYTYFVAESSAAVVPPGAQNVNFTLSKVTGGMTGKVSDLRTGLPVVGATLQLSGPVYTSCTTDDSGSYQVALKDGSYWVSASAPGYFSYSPSTNVVVAGGVVTFDILLGPCGVISGTVHDKAGKAIPYANISAHDTSYLYYGYGYSDALGKYTVTNLQTGSYVVSAHGNAYLTGYYQNATDPLQATLVAVQEGSESPNIDFVLIRGGSIAGRVADRIGVPIPGANITVYDTNYMARAWGGSNDSGNYVSGGLPTGDYLVNVSVYPYLSAWYDNASSFLGASKVHVVVEDTTRNINFSLAKGASLAGYVWDDQKKPVPYAWVYAFDTLGSGYQGQSTNDSGRYQISGLPAGVYKATLPSGYAPQWYDHKASFEAADTIRLVLEQNRGDINFDIQRAPGIYGSVVDDSTGAIIAGATVYVMSDDGSYYSTMTGYSGSYGLALPAGKYVLRVACDNGIYACRYYYRSDGLTTLERDADMVSVTDNGIRPTINFRLPVDTKDFGITTSNLDVTMTNRGLFSNSGVSTKPSGRWPNPQGKNYLYESDFWMGGSFGGVTRQFGDFYGTASGRWHASTNFSAPEDKYFEKVQTSFYNTDYAYWSSGMCVVVRQELDAWPDADFVICRQMLFHDVDPSNVPPAISSLYAGLFADFDVSNGAQKDLVGIDTANGLIYMYDGGKTDSTYVGACLLGAHPARLAWWNAPSDTAYRSEFARQQLLKTDAGVSVPTKGDDYRVLVSTGPYTLNPGDSLAVSMALVAGKGKQALIAAAQVAKAKYIELTTGVNDLPPSRVPSEFALSQNYPNPFNPSTNIAFDVPRRSHVLLRVFNVLGQRVATLVDEVRSPGHYTVQWSGLSLASGVYFYSMQTESFVQTQKMVLLK